MAEATPVDSGSSATVELPTDQVKELPSRPATVADALPMVPGVVRKPDGGLEISGSPEHRSSLIVNSADVTDPATGQFGLTVPIDSVQSVTVYQTPFLAEYGRFTAGLVSVETRRGGDEWKWELNDPFPDFIIRSWRLRGVRDATPRLNAEGPIVKQQAVLFRRTSSTKSAKCRCTRFLFLTTRRRTRASIPSRKWIGSNPISNSSPRRFTLRRSGWSMPGSITSIPSRPRPMPARATTRRPWAINGVSGAACWITRYRRPDSAPTFGVRARKI